MVHVGVKGQLDLYKLAKAFKDAGQRELGKKLDKGIRGAAKVIEREVTKSTDTYMPKGFEKTFKASLKAKHEVRVFRGRSVSIIFTATGKKELRKLDDMEKGRLRHPVHGRYRRLKSGARMKNPWVVQRIRPGVIEEPARHSQTEAVRTLDDAVQPLIAELNNIT